MARGCWMWGKRASRTQAGMPVLLNLCFFHEKVGFVKHNLSLSSLNPLFGADRRGKLANQAARPQAPFPDPWILFRAERDRSRARVSGAAGEPLTDPSRPLQSDRRERGRGSQGACPLAEFEAAPQGALQRALSPVRSPFPIVECCFPILPDSTIPPAAFVFRMPVRSWLALLPYAFSLPSLGQRAR
jgi:hypothetical protein